MCFISTHSFCKTENSPSLPHLVNLCICYAHLQQFSPGHYQQHVCGSFLSMGLLLKGHQFLKWLRSAESEYGAAGEHFPLSIDIYKLIVIGAGLRQVGGWKVVEKKMRQLIFSEE